MTAQTDEADIAPALKRIGVIEIPAHQYGLDASEIEVAKKIISDYQNFSKFMTDSGGSAVYCEAFKFSVIQTVKFYTDEQIMHDTQTRTLSDAELFIALVYLIKEQSKNDSVPLLDTGDNNIFYGEAHGAPIAVDLYYLKLVGKKASWHVRAHTTLNWRPRQLLYYKWY